MIWLLLGVLAIASLMFVASVVHYLDLQVDQREDLTVLYGAFLGLILFLWCCSLRGHYALASYGLLIVLFLAALHITIRWSFELPIGQLLYALIIIFAGITLSSRAMARVTLIVAGTLLSVSYAQITHHMQPNINWRQTSFQMGDAATYVALLCLITLAAWLTSREVSQALQQAKAAEARLGEELSNLEVCIQERTRDLESAQLLRVVELQRFAEFGQISANLLHDVTNPLTAASLHLQQCDKPKSRPIIQAQQSLQQLERYVESARSQLQRQNGCQLFSVEHELDIVRQMMQPVARKRGVQLITHKTSCGQLRGDPIKFNQLLVNVIANAIDAYDETRRSSKKIIVSARALDAGLCIKVLDHGKGISKVQLGQIFESFYTTKTTTKQGLGLGLALVKHIVENEFAGSISVTSTRQSGTCFTLELHHALEVLAAHFT